MPKFWKSDQFKTIESRSCIFDNIYTMLEISIESYNQTIIYKGISRR